MTKKKKKNESVDKELELKEKEIKKIEFSFLGITIKATAKQLLIILLVLLIGVFFILNVSFSWQIGNFNFSSKPVKIKKHKDTIQVGADKVILKPINDKEIKK